MLHVWGFFWQIFHKAFAQNRLKGMLWTYRCIIRYAKVRRRWRSKSFHLLGQTLANATDAKRGQQVANCCSNGGDEWSPLCFSRSPQLWIHPRSTFVLKIEAAETVSKTLSVSCPTASSSPSNASVQIPHTAVRAERHLHSGLEMLPLLLLSPLETHPYGFLPRGQKGPFCPPQTAFQTYRSWRVLWSSSCVLCSSFPI